MRMVMGVMVELLEHVGHAFSMISNLTGHVTL